MPRSIRTTVNELMTRHTYPTAVVSSRKLRMVKRACLSSVLFWEFELDVETVHASMATVWSVVATRVWRLWRMGCTGRGDFLDSILSSAFTGSGTGGRTAAADVTTVGRTVEAGGIHDSDLIETIRLATSRWSQPRGPQVHCHIQ